MGPLPATARGNRFTLVISDYFTRWAEAYPISDHKPPTVAGKLVDKWTTRYGLMQTLHSDQGRDFESNVFQEVVKMLGIHRTRNTPHHPECDGLVKLFNRTLKNMLSKCVDDNILGHTDSTRAYGISNKCTIINWRHTIPRDVRQGSSLARHSSTW